ncbi:MAG: dTMP kinase [Gammaproteobacteria bacterium]|nr:dTMP kinase [Gammaproteobacteria bacterium]
MKGRFITLEGGEGVGKTTNLHYIRSHLEQAGHKVLQTREPGGTDMGEAVRNILLDEQYKGMNADAELLLVFAARAEHLHQVILPALDRGEWVLCDRFTDATYAYQGSGRGIDMQRIALLEQWVQGDLRPDFTLLLDVAVETGMQRAGDRSAPDRFEQEEQVFFERVRAGYRKQAKQAPERYRVIDASLDLVGVQQQIAAVLDEIILK